MKNGRNIIIDGGEMFGFPVNDWVLLQTHPLSSAAKKVVAEFKPKFEGAHRVLKVQNNNLILWKAGKKLMVNIDQVRFYHQRKSDENVIIVGNSDSSGSRYQASSFEGVRPRSDWSQNSKNMGSGERRETKEKMTGHKEDQGVTDKRTPHVGSKESSLQTSRVPEKKRGKVSMRHGEKRSLPASTNCSNCYRKKFWRAEAATSELDICLYNLRSRIKEAAESRPSRGQRQDQGGPVWSRGRTKIKDTSSSPQARAVRSLGEDDQAVRVREEAEEPNSNNASKWEENTPA
ncbi:hypothetical protein TNCV_4458101 [Trichonephila clavipes]|nr:hypothetical protein TNCV_4458101 [Trichonephila clavipes]